MMLKQTATIHRFPQKLQVFLLAGLVLGMNPLASLASETNPLQTEEAPIALEAEPSEFTEDSLTEDCLPTSDSEEFEDELTDEEGQPEETPEATDPCATAEAVAEDEFADADDTEFSETELAAEETPDASGPSINVNINIGSGGPLIGIGSSGHEEAFPPDDDFGELPEPGLEEPVEEVLPVAPGKTLVGPKILTPKTKAPAKASKDLIRKTGLQTSKSAPKRRVRLKSPRIKSKRVKPSARRLKRLRKQIKSNRRQIKSLGKRLNKHQRRLKSPKRRLRRTLRRSPAGKRPFRRIKTVRPMMQRM